MLELYQKPLSEIPVASISAEKQEKFVKIVDEILGVAKLEREYNFKRIKTYLEKIDSMVYELYGLTEEEIDIVEKQYPQKR